MSNYHLKRGLDLPVAGSPLQEISPSPDLGHVGLVGADYIGLKPRMLVEEGEAVGAGTPVLMHKDMPDVLLTSPISGRIKAINRGARRVLVSVEIEASNDGLEPVDFSSVGNIDTKEGITEKLCKSGLWTSFRTRPYSKVPDPATTPTAIFITAMDSEPHAPKADLIISQAADAFEKGVDVISKLSGGKTYVCHENGADIPAATSENVEKASFSGPHPSGLPGTHINILNPPTTEKFVWTIWYQDVIAIGRLALTGKLDSERVISLAGPKVKNPRLIKTVLGGSINDLTTNEVDDSVLLRTISGSILSGRSTEGPDAYLGRYDRQITVIEEDRKQIPGGWIRPMASKFSYQPVLLPQLGKKVFNFTSNLNGGRRAMVPTGTFEELMPQDYLPTQLLRSLLVMDTDSAQALGALDLDEEDLALVGFACPAKYEYGLALRDCLTKIEKEG